MTAATLAADMIHTDALIRLCEDHMNWFRDRIGQFSDEQLLYGANLSQGEIDALMQRVDVETHRSVL